MTRLLSGLSSPALTIAGFALLALVLLAGVAPEAWPAAPVVLCLAVLALNLAAAMATRPRLRRGGLGLFHLALLVLLLLAGWGRLTHLDGRIEIGEGAAFDPAQISARRTGRWHADRLGAVHFTQGRIQVDYAPGLKRGHTRSEAVLPEGTVQVVGDDTPLVLEGYRFYTTSNKGLAVLLEWQDARGGEAATGLLHLPSYPFYDYMQENTWKAPDGHSLTFRLKPEREVPTGERWTLAPHEMRATLLVKLDGSERELQPGQALQTASGNLRFLGVRGWMGYRIFHDPTLLPLLAVALTGILGLAWHLWRRWNPQVRERREEVVA